MFFPILTIIVLCIAALVGLAATKPSMFRIQRTGRINAPPDKIFPLINDFRNWNGWSPWANIDPNIKKSFTGPVSGVGTVFAWDGNKKAGAGRMEILESSPSSKIRIQLDFLRPFKAHNTAEFTLNAASGVTTVNWAMYGPQPFMAKVMSLFFNCDKMVGKEFEKGLASMKTLAEQ